MNNIARPPLEEQLANTSRLLLEARQQRAYYYESLLQIALRLDQYKGGLVVIGSVEEPSTDILDTLNKVLGEFKSVKERLANAEDLISR